MTCTPVKIGDTTAIVCNRDKLPRRCPFCNRHWAGLLCDHPIGRGKTCDRRMCRRCATKVGPDRHLCPEHKAAARQGALAL